jgi:hypothetical protein
LRLNVLLTGGATSDSFIVGLGGPVVIVDASVVGDEVGAGGSVAVSVVGDEVGAGGSVAVSVGADESMSIAVEET